LPVAGADAEPIQWHWRRLINTTTLLKICLNANLSAPDSPVIMQVRG